MREENLRLRSRAFAQLKKRIKESFALKLVWGFVNLLRTALKRQGVCEIKSMEDYVSIARKIFEGSRYRASDDDVKRLADNMVLLEKRGLGKLNKRLDDSNNKVWDTIAEHEFAVILISRHSSTIPISYEPDALKPPPDFKVEIGNITYWIQTKALSKLERENRQDKIILKIKEASAEIKVGKVLSCMLSDDFKEDSLPELINFIKDKATSAREEEMFLFKGKNNQKAEIKFWSPAKTELPGLTLGFSGDSDSVMLNITGLDSGQIEGSLRKAVKAFNWEVDPQNINLIVMEADNKEDIDICDALFGTEYEIIGKSNHPWSRQNDGLFDNLDFSKKVAGVIAMKRKPEKWKFSSEEEIAVESLAKKYNMTPEQYKEQIKRQSPIADYFLILYMNNSFKYLLEDIKKLLRFDKIVYDNMRPPMGDGNFRSGTE